MALKLCFGIKIDAGIWGKALGIKHDETKSKTCSFCRSENSKKNNFCGNCGTDLRRMTDASPEDIVELTLSRLGGPPKPIELISGRNCIYLCQILATSDDDFVAFQRPAERFPWSAIERAIQAYADMPTMEEARPFLFALDNEKRSEKKK